MKNLLNLATGLALLVTSSIISAQPVPKPVLTYDKAVEAAVYLVRQKTYATECPFSEPAKVALSRLESAVRPFLNLAPAKLTIIDTDTRTATLEFLKEAKVKQMACPIAEGALLRQTRQPEEASASATSAK